MDKEQMQRSLDAFSQKQREEWNQLLERDKDLVTGPPKNFTLKGWELHLFEEWYAEHLKTCPFRNRLSQGAAGGAISYVFTPTDVGLAIEVKCACGAEKNVTDYDIW